MLLASEKSEFLPPYVRFFALFAFATSKRDKDEQNREALFHDEHFPLYQGNLDNTAIGPLHLALNGAEPGE